MANQVTEYSLMKRIEATSRSRHNITTAAPMFIIKSKHSTFTKYETLIFIYLRIYIIVLYAIHITAHLKMESV